MTGGIETDKKRLQHPATMTREQIVNGLRRAKSRAQSVAILIQRAIDELGDDEHANWSEADAAVWLALDDVEKLAAVTIDRVKPSAPTLHDLYIETGRRAVDAAGPEGGILVPREIADSLAKNEFRHVWGKPADGEVTP